MAPYDRIPKIDKQGSPFELGECGSECAPEVKEMYDGFARLAISQGLPPAEKEIRDRWVDGLFESGRNFVTWKGDKAVGHSVIIPDFDRNDAEYVVFVSEPFRNLGLGTALTTLALDVSRALGLNRIWLTVESFNFRAMRLYRNAGFKSIDEGEHEKTMILRL